MVGDSAPTAHQGFTAGAPGTCRKKRMTCKSSRYFDAIAQPGFPARAPGSKKSGSCTSSRYFDEAPAGRLERGGVMVTREARSEYFASSADSCAGSADSFDWGSAFTLEAFVALKACERFKESGVRHLCRDKCYYYAYEPFRKWHALRLKVAEAGSSTKILDGWSVQADRGQRAKQPSWRIKYVSPDVRARMLGVTCVSDFAAEEADSLACRCPGWFEGRTFFSTSSHVPTSAKRVFLSISGQRVFHNCTDFTAEQYQAKARVPSTQQGKEYASAKPALEALGLGHSAMLPPTVRRRKATHTSLRQQEPSCSARQYPDGPAYLLKKPLVGAFPPSPFGLIEEILTNDPWRLLIGCIMLNQTTRSQVCSCWCML